MKFWGRNFPIRNLWRVKLWQIPACLLSLFMSRDIVLIWMVKFGKPPVICQIYQDFPLPKISVWDSSILAILLTCFYWVVNFKVHATVNMCTKDIKELTHLGAKMNAVYELIQTFLCPCEIMSVRCYSPLLTLEFYWINYQWMDY